VEVGYCIVLQRFVPHGPGIILMMERRPDAPRKQESNRVHMASIIDPFMIRVEARATLTSEKLLVVVVVPSIFV
jgi:hypothetical protein